MITAEFCTGSLGETVRIDTDSAADIRRLSALFRALADGTVSEQRLREWAEVRIERFADLVMQRSAAPTRFEQSVFRADDPESGLPTFAWSESPDVWEDCADLASPVGGKGRPGHQYFSK